MLTSFGGRAGRRSSAGGKKLAKKAAEAQPAAFGL
jgi:hypothetical protein